MFRKVSGIKNVKEKRGGGYHDFPFKKLSYTTEKFRRGKLLCLRKILVWKHSCNRGGEVSRFSVETFLSQY